MTDARKETTTHVIRSIQKKDGSPYNGLHANLIGARCVPWQIGIGDNGWLLAECDYAPGELHRIRTSTVKDVVVRDHTIFLSTENSIYELEMIPVQERVTLPMRGAEYWQAFRT